MNKHIKPKISNRKNMKTIKELEAENNIFTPIIKAEIKTLKGVLGLIDKIYKKSQKRNTKIMFMSDFVEELKARIKGSQYTNEKTKKT